MIVLMSVTLISHWRWSLGKRLRIESISGVLKKETVREHACEHLRASRQKL